MNGQPRLRVGQITDRGKRRPRNEDHIGGPPADVSRETLQRKGHLYVVADGMGGQAGGERASDLAVNRVMREYYADSDTDIQRSLSRAIKLANSEIYNEAHSVAELSTMGTTLTAAVIRGDELVVAHVGDSRAYLIRGNQIRQLTQDHTWVDEAVRKGIITPEEAKNSPESQRHYTLAGWGIQISRSISPGSDCTPATQYS